MRLSFEKNTQQSLIEKIGFGCWGLGGDAYGSIEDKDAIELVQYAYKNGIRTFDTSPLYGDGASERFLGSALKTFKRDSFKIITKAGLFKMNGEEVRDYTPKGIKDSVHCSIDRLQTEYVDFFLIHSPSFEEFEISYQSTFGVHEELKNQTIRNLGISMKAPKDFEFVKKLNELSAIEFNLSLMDQRAQNSFGDLIDFPIFRIARTPFNFGFLTDSPPGPTPPHDSKSHLSAWSQKQFDLWHEFRLHWKKIADQNEMSLNEFALLFCLSHESVDLVIPGFMKKEHIDSAVNMQGRGKLSVDSMLEIYDLYNTVESKFSIRNKSK